ncbi:esterase FE4 isoform X1 [Aphis craccivora]|uniref:Esterase FE4 isoform X1 n=1 Tax=Aphis craccivora TaxID=307492 RepID=A0A6G0ZMB7_APHCR|nr:esterase FE4 isoform X1 [Aphis craccivora]
MIFKKIFLQTIDHNNSAGKMEVVIEQGVLKGFQNKTLLSNKPYISFLGIPYAKAPVNDLRFKAPVKHPGWSGVLNAISERDKCMQYAFRTNHIIGSEDCLYLNVLVPQVQNESNGKLAVMIFIHGGGFNHGGWSADKYSPDYLLDENVIVVAMNYRLNVLGFLNLDIDECPGNMGLKDQLLAIKWVKSNIAAFGGDANNITIFGVSSGSATVHYQTMSPQSTGFFQKAIMQSGCAFNPRSFNEDHRASAYKLANNLGCLSSDPKEILKYLKNVSVIDLVKETKFRDETDYLEYKFVPSLESDVVSNPFLPAHPKTLAISTIPIPVIIGLTDMEGIIALLEDRLNEFSDDDHITHEISKLFKNRYNTEALSKIKDFYFKKSNIGSETIKLESICHLHSDFLFCNDFYDAFDCFLKQNVTPVYKYEFKFDGELNAAKNLVFATRPVLRHAIKGACHADDMYYLFRSEVSGVVPKPNSPEHEMCKMMSKMWTNFAKTGDPNSPDLSFKWINASSSDLKYLSIDGDRTRMIQGMINNNRFRFWKELSESNKCCICSVVGRNHNNLNNSVGKMEVVIKQGVLKGLRNKTLLSNKPYVSFLGIPYAKAPVNDLRFKAPVKHPGWSGVLNAISERDKCMQYAFMTNQIIGSEDCLYLNVLVPQVQKESNGKFAVMIFIHGGAFNYNGWSINRYSPDYLLDENVIVVAMNYRLNALGFLNLDIDECPGNMGLKDQLLAIKWVKSNIAAFGGDANNITIFGVSSGSASVHYHTISPQSTGLFQKAIMQSGCAFNQWALNKNHRASALKLANNLGCLSSDPKKIDETDFLDYKFVPSIESDVVSNPFLPAHPKTLAISTIPIPVIIGLTDMEGIVALSEDKVSQFSDDDHITDEISKLFKNRNIDSETIKLESICHLHSDFFLCNDFYDAFHCFLKQNVTPVYKYEFKFDGELNAAKNMIFATRPVLRHAIKGACHADEMYYLFRGDLPGLPKPNTPEHKMCIMMSKMWTNFAKTGDPNSPDLSFKWINANSSDLKYLSIDGDRTLVVEI